MPSDLDGFVSEPGYDPRKFNFGHDDFVVDFDDNGDGYEGCAAEAWEEFVSRAVEATSAAEAATMERNMRVKFEVSISFEVELEDVGADRQVRTLLSKIDDATFAVVMSPLIAPGLDEESYVSRIDTYNVAAPPRCERCGQSVYGRYCQDEKCGFHFYPQGDSRGWGDSPSTTPSSPCSRAWHSE